MLEFRLRHFQLGKYACLWTSDGCLYGSTSEPNEFGWDVYTLVAWESLGKATVPIAKDRTTSRVISATDPPKYAGEANLVWDTMTKFLKGERRTMSLLL